LYISNGSSSKIDYRFFGQTQKESDNYLKTLDNGTYKMYYIRIITDNENENSSNPMSSSPSFNTNVQYEIGTNLNNLNGNTTIKPSDSNI
jgi:hypothetical protein